MATLDNAARRAIWRDIMEEESYDKQPIAIVKEDLREAVNSIDDWIEANMASMNQALPARFRGDLTARQKALILHKILLARFRIG